MSQVLTVPTHFNDIGELSEGFLDRVERDTLILYGPVAYEDGSPIEFAVLLADGTVALEGAGVVRAAVDGGADRVPETRYDVVVEALELDGRYEVVFERLVLARQAVSEPPSPDPEENEPTGELDAAPATEESADEPSADHSAPDEARAYVNDVELGAEEIFSLAPGEVQSVAPDESDSGLPEESAAETDPPDDLDDDEPETSIEHVEVEDEFADEDELATVVAAVDPEAMMADAEEAQEAEAAEAPSEETDEDGERESQQGVIEAGKLGIDADYAFEHGIALEPQVGMPVPIPSMAAPPEAPPAPPRLRLAEPPDGLTRPSRSKAEELPFSTDGEVSDVHTTGLFAYEDGLPIPSRPPMPDPSARRSASVSEAQDESDVEESEPPESNDDEYEEVRLSDFAGAVEEG
ncbi:MAG: hypothetical protein KJO40_20760 [Deltaproteobacteria bacterium]|nr:hypothetical protein [Deltaproteobacteria bacterium]NND29252.1 hypothetical protein [Myxococcales bacterium]MBT8463719.1 hypothetical protein [Deltaproteobacteria bacterium]MBT8483382.1 hypothetical protein [Deltaproteobacteria bacterium]NNK05885.1 hypothetical protein [Myxococcales bacterium]